MTRIQVFTAVLAIVLLLGSPSARAEEPTVAELQQANAELRAEIERLRARVAALSRRITDDALADTAFLVSTREGVVRVLPDGSTKAVLAPDGRPLRGALSRSGDDVFCRSWRTIRRLGLSGTVLATYELQETVVGHGYAALPGRRLAVFDNEKDRIFVVDPSGRVLRELAMRPEPDAGMQNTYGLVVDGRLLVSEDGDKGILAVDLDTYAVETFRRFETLRSWIGAIAHADGTYYVCTGTDVYAFTTEGPLRRVARLPKGNISGMVIVGGAAFVVVNFTGELLRIDLESGEVTTVAAGLARPDGLVTVPR